MATDRRSRGRRLPRFTRTERALHWTHATAFVVLFASGELGEQRGAKREAFKQDFARWETLKRQATVALEQAESTLSKKLQANASKDRLAAGVEDNAPAEYRKQVDSYFKAIAGKKP